MSISEPDPWKPLIKSFVAGEIEGPAFEQAFLDLFRLEVSKGISQRYAVDLLFYEVDAYCADPSLLGPEDIDEVALRKQAQRCLERWDEPWPKI